MMFKQPLIILNICTTMNKAFLIEGKYLVKFKSVPCIGALKDVLVLEPKSEQRIVENSDKQQRYINVYNALTQKMKETTSDDERNAYGEEMKKLIKQAQQEKPLRAKSKRLKARILRHDNDQYYEVEIVNMPKKWLQE